jgi:A/G-specific adenine glycosylase
MLQQTQVSRVIPYFNRFVKRFPNIRCLAHARIQTILRYWQGLGYYSRAWNLHAAAKKITAEYNGHIPQSTKQLAALPGIGQYTAAAVASIAFDVNTPLVDGNVARVLCRLFCITDNPKRVHNKLWSLALNILSKGNAGLFNQSMMELGATVCTPKKPSCIVCPLSRLCKARENGQQANLPVTNHKKKKPCLPQAVAIIRKNEKFLIVKQTKRRSLRGLWQFPSIELKHGQVTETVISKHFRNELGFKAAIGRRLKTVYHTYSHFIQELHPFETRLMGKSPKFETQSALRWVDMKTINKYPFSGAHQKILLAIQ